MLLSLSLLLPSALSFLLVLMLPHEIDHYNGVTVFLDENEAPNEALLQSSVETWKAEGRVAVWLHVPQHASGWVPVATNCGFSFHSVNNNSDPKTLLMTQWLLNSPSRLPMGPTHQVGVGCFLVHPTDPTRMLVVQERTGPAAASRVWKMPTGLVDPGEDMHDAAVRECWEETGLKVHTLGLLALRQAHPTEQGTTRRTVSDLFGVCRVALDDPNDVDSGVACPTEIAALQWMSIRAYCAQERWQSSPVYLALNRALLVESSNALWKAQTLELTVGSGHTNALYTSSISDDDNNAAPL